MGFEPFPTTVFRGKFDHRRHDLTESKGVANEDELAKALEDGWRRHPDPKVAKQHAIAAANASEPTKESAE